MFGPVPVKYRLITWVCGLAAFAGLGAWVSPALPLSAPLLASVGLTLGALVVALFLHDFGRPTAAPVRRRRHP